MKKIEERTIPIGNLKNYPKNGYSPNQAAIDALAEDIRKNRLKVPLTVMAIKEKPGYFWVISGNLRLPACKKADLKVVSIIVMEYDSDDEIMEDLLGYNMGRIKCEYDKAWEFVNRRTLLNRKRGPKAEQDDEETGKTNAIIGAPYDISGDQVGKYIRIYENSPKLFKFIDEKKPSACKLTIGGAENIITFLEDRKALSLSENDMMKEVLKFIDGKLPADENEFEYAFTKAVPKLGRIMKEKRLEAVQESNSGKIHASNKVITKVKRTNSKPAPKENLVTITDLLNRNIISQDEANDLMKFLKGQEGADLDCIVSSLGYSFEGSNYSTVAEDALEVELKRLLPKLKSSKDGEIHLEGCKDKLENESIQSDETNHLIPTQTGTTITDTTITAQEQTPDKVQQGELKDLYIKDSIGNFVPYTCPCDTCPFDKEKHKMQLTKTTKK